MARPSDATYSEAETARRRDATIRNMHNTPPQPRKPKRKPSPGKRASAKRKKPT